MRALHTISLGLIALSLPGCFDHHTADEQVLELVEVEDGGVSNGTTPKDASVSRADGGSGNCAGPDIFASILCTVTGGGGGTADAAAPSLDAIIKQILGGTGTGTQNCAKQTDPLSQILCSVTGGSGIEGIIGSLLGGGGDAGAGGGLDGIITDVLTDTLTSIIDDLIKSLLTPQPTTPRDGGAGGLFGGLFGGTTGGGTTPTPRRDAGAGGLFGGLFGGTGLNPSIGSTNQALTESDLVRSDAECASVDPDDLLTRLICARQKLDTLSGR